MKKNLLLLFIFSIFLTNVFSAYVPPTRPISTIKIEKISNATAITKIVINSNSNFTLYASSGSGTKIDPWIIQNYNISSVEISSTTDYFILQNITIFGNSNTLNNILSCGIYLYHVYNGQIINNKVFNYSYGIEILSSERNIIENNLLNENSNGIFSRHSAYNLIQYNQLNNNLVGIGLEGSNSETLGNNTIKNSNTGISLTSTSKNTISNNTIYNNVYNGIVFMYASSNVIVNNYIFEGSNFGISFESNSINNTFIDNVLVSCMFDLRDIIQGGELQGPIINNTVNGIELQIFQNYNNVEFITPIQQLILINCSNITISNQIMSSNSLGIQIINCSNFNISNNSFRDLLEGINLFQSTNISVNHNSFKNCSIGIYLTYTERTTINFNSINDGGNGINNYYSNNNIIENNRIVNNIFYGMNLYYSHNNTISNNLFINDSLQLNGGSLLDYQQNLVTNNSINGKPLVFLQNEKNYVVINTGQTVLVNCSFTVVANPIVSNINYPIQIYYSRNITIANGTIIHSFYPIDISNSNGILLENNQINSNFFGISIVSSNNTLIKNNNISNNIGSGISLSHTYFSLLEQNEIINNTGVGIGMIGVFYTVIRFNLIEKNSYYGISIYFGYNNSIFLNSFINNSYYYLHASQAYSVGGHNSWTNGTYGNYWSDYSGNDTNHDNIGDQPYSIDPGYENDSLPLMAQPDIKNMSLTINQTADHKNYILLISIVVVGFLLLVSGAIINQLRWKKSFNKAQVTHNSENVTPALKKQSSNRVNVKIRDLNADDALEKLEEIIDEFSEEKS